jgi:hypothetical protein
MGQRIKCRILASKQLSREYLEFKINIRNETISDIEEISQVTIAAFRNLAISIHTEQFIINEYVMQMS